MAASFPLMEGNNTIPLRLLTWNLRYDSLPDGIAVNDTIRSLPKAVPNDTSVVYYGAPTELPWSTRRVWIADEVLFAGVDVFAVQEALKRQVEDLQILLGSTYSHIGVGRDDGQEAGEYAAIFYRNTTVQLNSWDTFWLSPTPFFPSRYPGAGSTRVATVANFTAIDRQGNQTFTLICTHLDNVSEESRRFGASLLRYRGAYEAFTAKRPVFVLGDFNSPTTGADSGAYNVITGQYELDALPQDFLDRFPLRDRFFQYAVDYEFKDLMAETVPWRRGGHLATFTGFESAGDSSEFKRIDFVMGGSNEG
ncbi:hypothetical protein RUND412_011492, partial [Rhizina undulata]